MNSLSTQAVKAIIINQNQEILFVQSDASKHYIWDLPGGLIERNEIEKDALKRECYEELKITITIIEKLFLWKFIRSSDNEEVIVQNYLCSIPQQYSIQLSDEHINYKWISMREIEKYNLKDSSLKKGLKHYFNRKY
ncbi:MAG: NUDIX domain-containing protein [Candidatus Nanoarchaeia archaeon]